MNQKKGFTLIELLVVIAVIGLLSLLTVISLGQKREQMRDTQRLSNLRDIQAHLELYFVNHNEYPIIAAPGKPLGQMDTACLSNSGFAPENCPEAIMKNIPKDPSDYQYMYSSTDGSSYTIIAQIEGNVEGMSGKIQVTPSNISAIGG